MTRLYRDVAVVLRTYKLAEADRIVVLMTEGHGKVRAVAKGVRKSGSKIPALAVTAFARNEDAARARSAGFQQHMSKPVDPGKLSAAVALLARKA